MFEAAQSASAMPRGMPAGGRLSPMASTDTPLNPSLDHHVEPDTDRRRRAVLVLATAAVVALMGGWVYILFFYDPGLMIDELPDRAFPDQAEQVCAAARTELDSVPVAQNVTSATERAEAVAQSNVILRSMVADLEPLVELVPEPPARFREGTQSWLNDWSSYLDSRERYVDNLRTDDDARYLESSKGSPTKGITRAINGFAQVNEMMSCETPGDLS